MRLFAAMVTNRLQADFRPTWRSEPHRAQRRPPITGGVEDHRLRKVHDAIPTGAGSDRLTVRAVLAWCRRAAGAVLAHRGAGGRRDGAEPGAPARPDRRR